MLKEKKYFLFDIEKCRGRSLYINGEDERKI